MTMMLRNVWHDGEVSAPELTVSNLSVVQMWVSAVNQKDIDHAERLSSADIEIVGPRSSAKGHDVLRDWIARAGITLITRRSFARSADIVLEQEATWNSSETGGRPSTSVIVMLFTVQDAMVRRVRRSDSLDAALTESRLTEADEIRP